MIGVDPRSCAGLINVRFGGLGSVARLGSGHGRSPISQLRGEQADHDARAAPSKHTHQCTECKLNARGASQGTEWEPRKAKGTRKAIFWAPKVWDATFLTCDARLMVSHEILNPKPFKTGDRFVDENNGQFSERPCNGHVRSVCKLKNLESLKNVASLQGRTQCPRKRVVRRLKQLEEAMRERD